jgi:VanZ family protein
MIGGKLASISLLPFAGYGAGSYLNSLSDLLTKLGVSLPLGVSAAFLFQRSRGPVAAALLLAIAALLATIETGQLFLPTRYPDPTDVLVGVTGACIGLVVGRSLQGNQQ